MLTQIKGKIQPQGWIREFLLRDKDGITGYLDRLCPDAACGIFEDRKVKDEIDGCWSSWWPGETEGNWRDALTRLSFALDDPVLIRRTTEYVDRILAHQDETGYIGIFLYNERFGNGARSGELWTQSRIMTCLLSYYDHTQEQRVLDALERLADLIVRQYGPLAGGRSLYEAADEDGSKTHSLMVVEPLLRLYERLGKAEYRDFCEFLFADYSRYAPDAKFPCYDIGSSMAADPGEPFVGHGPHTCEQLRIPLLLYRATGKREYYAVFRAAFQKLRRYLTLSGSCKSDELIGAYQGNLRPEKRVGIDLGECYPIPGAGYEYCSTTELMFSFTAALCQTENLEFADMEEWMILNAAMSARRPDGKAILYLCADNLYEATKQVGDRWDYSPTHIDAAVCCAPNSGKIMPFHLENMWLCDEQDRLYAVQYGPCTLKTQCGGSELVIEESTEFPFENRIAFQVQAAPGTALCLRFRLPVWSDGARVSLNGEELACEAGVSGEGRYLELKRVFASGDRITVDFAARPRFLKAVDGTRAVAFGPLLYALDIPAVGEDYFHYEQEPFCDTNYRPAEGAKWDYTLLYRPDRPWETVQVCRRDTQGYGWEQPPVTLRAKLLSPWAIPEWVELVPIGCTTLRRTTFPAVNIKRPNR